MGPGTAGEDCRREALAADTEDDDWLASGHPSLRLGLGSGPRSMVTRKHRDGNSVGCHCGSSRRWAARRRGGGKASRGARARRGEWLLRFVDGLAEDKVGLWAAHVEATRLDCGGGGPAATIPERRSRTAPGACAGSHWRDFGQWLGGSLTRSALPSKAKLGHTVAWAGPVYSFSFFSSIFQYSNTFQLVKYDKVTSKAPKIYKLVKLIDQFKCGMFHFCRNFKFSLDFKL
jgi:hypothetical protein